MMRFLVCAAASVVLAAAWFAFGIMIGTALFGPVEVHAQMPGLVVEQFIPWVSP